MLGKRPRPLQRNPSSTQLLPNDPPDFTFAFVPVSTVKIKPYSPSICPPRQVIGFNLVHKNDDACDSPRSVLEPKALSGIEKVASQEKPARSVGSPRSGLESLLSSARSPWDKKGSEGVGLGIVAAIYAEETDATKVWVNEPPKETAVVSSQAVLPLKCGTICSSTLSEPIPILQTNVLPSCRETRENRVSKVAHETLDDAILSSQGGRRNQPRNVRLDVDVDDEELGFRESIFSTASPASSCNDNWGELPAIDFLNACYFCKRLLLLGKDIYMYRGDRAFCSAECRYQQILIDEHKERCSAAAFKEKATVTPGPWNHRSRVLATTTAAAA